MTQDEVKLKAEELTAGLTNQSKLYKHLYEDAEKAMDKHREALGSKAAQGDLSENAAHAAAKEALQESMAEAKSYLDRYEAYEAYTTRKYTPGNTIKEGTTIELTMLTPSDSGMPSHFVFKVVPALLGDAAKGYLSLTSEVGQSVLGLKAHTKFSIDTIKGVIDYEIGEIY